MQIKHKYKGFTLIELLVVIAIIGLLSTMAVVALNNARVKSRDAKRISDIKQMQTALELFFADQDTYPTYAGATGATASAQLCNTTLGYDTVVNCTAASATYMGKVPANPTPNGTAYTYAISGTDDYSITFTLEEATGDLAAGLRTASAAGIQ
jgi:prepilin-type N-terminal cleavage/methylation domain-containing protein